MNRLRLKKNALNKKTVYKKLVFRLKHPLRAEFLEMIVRAIWGFTVRLIFLVTEVFFDTFCERWWLVNQVLFFNFQSALVYFY